MPAFGGLPFADNVCGRARLIRGQVIMKVERKYPVRDNPFVEINADF